VTGDQSFSVAEDPTRVTQPYARLDISFAQSPTSPQAELEALGPKLQDPKLTAAERNAAMARMAEAQRKMVEELTRGLKTDPASLDRKRDDVGWKNFNGGVLNVTGTMTRVR
jgi:hypothetical protein